MSKKDLTGQKHGKLTVIKQDFSKSNKNHTSWVCECECGNIKSYYSFDLNPESKTYHTHCGCERKSRQKYKNGEHVKIWKKTRVYSIWDGMVQRCCNFNNVRYKDYGGRGITVCNEWKSSSNFIEWSMENGYTDELTIDRIDVNGNYEPNNCRWVTMKEQYKNKRNTIYVIYNDNKICLLQLLEDLNRKNDYKNITNRLSKGWSIDDALNIPNGISKLEYNFGKSLIDEFSNKENGFNITKKEFKIKYNIHREFRDYKKSSYIKNIINNLHLIIETFKIIKNI